MSVKIFGSTGIEFSDSNQEIKIKGPTQTFSLKATTDDEFTVYNAANKLWGMNSTGHVNTNTPYFHAYRPSPNFAVTATLDILAATTVVTNLYNFYDNTTYKATAPIAGLYQFNFFFNTYGSSGDRTYAGFRLNETTSYFLNVFYNGNGSDHSASAAYAFYLNEGDYVNAIYKSSGTATASAGVSWNGFSGYLIG